MAQLVRHVFGPEGRAYIRRYLEANRDYEADLAKPHLGGALLRHHDIERGVVWAVVPDTARPEYVTRFEFGGPFWESGLRCEPGLEPWINDLLSAPSSVVLAEDVLGTRTDGYYQKHPDAAVVFCDDAVYEYADSNDGAHALQLLGGDIRWRPDLAIVTTADEFVPGQQLSPLELDEMAARTRAIAVGAWDDEGIVCWEPSHHE